MKYEEETQGSENDLPCIKCTWQQFFFFDKTNNKYHLNIFYIKEIKNKLRKKTEHIQSMCVNGRSLGEKTSEYLDNSSCWRSTFPFKASLTWYHWLGIVAEKSFFLFFFYTPLYRQCRRVFQGQLIVLLF